MVTIEKTDLFTKCDNCVSDGEVVYIGSEYSAMVLCKKCLDELTDKLIKYRMK
ncbi:MAG: hypothetical protein ACRC18_06745 [Cetobacterium sp.]